MKVGDIVKIDGKEKKLAECRVCKALIVFVSKDEATGKWDIRNPDNTKHEDKKSFAKSYKFTLTVGRTISQNYNSVRVELSQEYPNETPKEKAYAETSSLVDALLEKEKVKLK